MKKHTEISTAFAATVFSFVCALVLAGCSNALLTFSPAAEDGVAATVPVTISLAGDATGAERTVTPTTNPAISEYQLLCGPSGGIQSLLAKFTAITPASKVNVTPGILDFTLKAFNADGIVLLEGFCNGIAIDSNPVNLSFSLCPLASGVGTISVSVTWPVSVAVSSVVPVFAGTTETAVSVVGTHAYTYAKSVDKGGYLLILSLRDSGGLEIASIPEFVKVYPNMPSVAAFSLVESDFNSAPLYPTGFTAASSGNVSDTANADVLLSWIDTSSNEKNFEIQYTDDDGANWTELASAVAPASTSFAATLSRGSSRVYRVRAVNDFGPSSWVTSAKFTAPWLFSFDSSGGSVVAAREVVSGTLTAKPQDPAKYGSLFDDWYTDGTFATVWDFASNTVTANSTVCAKWTKAIILDPNRGTGSTITLNWADNSTANLPTNTFTRTGYDFVGWSKQPLGAVLYDDAASYTMTTGDTLYARWVRSDATAGSYFTTVPNGTGLTITKYTGTGTNVRVVVPEMIDKKPVLRLEGTSTVYNTACFYNKTFVTEIVLPETLQTIAPYTFYNCSGLTAMVIPEGVTTLESGATYNMGIFQGCTNLISITLPGTLTNFGSYMFNGCTKLETVIFNNPGTSTLTSIGNNAFTSCTKLSSINLPNSITTLGSSAFTSCSSLVNITLPTNLASIGSQAFYGCTKLSSVNFPATLVSIGSNAFVNCASLTLLDIPSSVTTLADSAFQNCTALKTVTIAGNINVIGTMAFNGCASLETVTITGNVKELQGYYSYSNYGVFYNCTQLKSIDLGPALEIIGAYTFHNCDALTSIELPSTLKQIQDGAFYASNGLKTVIVNSPVLTTVGPSAFYNNTSLTSISLPPSLTSLGSGAFTGCTNLARVDLAGSFSSIESGLFSNCVSLESIVIPASVTSIASTAFSGCSALRTAVLPANLVTIGNSAFKDCLSLEEIEIPNAVTSIGSNAFQECQSLVSVKTGNALTTIGDYAFDACRSLDSVVLGVNVSTIGQYAFRNCQLSSINFPSKITKIDLYAFTNCDRLTTVVLPDSLTSMGNNAFADSDSLSTVRFGTGLSSVSERAFCNCPALAEVYMGSSVKTVKAYAFYHASKLKTIELTSVTAIEPNAFMLCTSLESVQLGANITNIAQLAFANCGKLTAVTIDALAPPTLVSANAFTGNGAARKFYVPEYEDNSILALYKSTAYWNTMADQIFEQ